MHVTLTKLADFKRFLAEPNASIVGVYHWRAEQMADQVRRTFFGHRHIKAVQTNGYWTNTGAWCDFGKASGWRFNGDEATCLLDNGEPAFTVRCEIREPA